MAHLNRPAEPLLQYPNHPQPEQNGQTELPHIGHTETGRRLSRYRSLSDRNELWHLLRKKEVVFCIIGGITLVAGLILIITGLALLRKSCQHCQYTCTTNKVTNSLSLSSVHFTNSQTEDLLTKTTLPVIPHRTNVSTVNFFPNYDPAYPAMKINLALGKTAVQSSTSRIGAYMLNASHAVDGNQDNHLSRGSCSQTDRELSPYWHVDLTKSETIKELKIVTPSDCCDGTLYNFEVRVSQDSTFASSILCKHFMGVTRKVAFTVPCDSSSVYGRYVRIQMLGDEDDASITNQLTLCEVVVYGR